MSNFKALQVEFAKESGHAFMQIAKLLKTLDIPIEMAPGRLGSGEEVLEAMVASRDLVHVAPMPQEHRAVLNTVMTLWLAAMFVASHADAEDGQWLLEAGLVQMIRLNHELKISAAVLRGEVEVIDYRDLHDDKE
ncbi:hypothetical protein [Nocardia niigatensis]|uniref:hypothetical protein n=1 Tax=Nocardia niigatensis TaxID=209249 RepID=UPI0002D91EC3|nr:hypothetical protein [Nocardia niigatensis]